jgi:hypothetical protein
MVGPNEGALGRPTEKPQFDQRAERLVADNRIKVPEALYLAPGQEQPRNLEVLPANDADPALNRIIAHRRQQRGQCRRNPNSRNLSRHLLASLSSSTFENGINRASAVPAEFEICAPHSKAAERETPDPSPPPRSRLRPDGGPAVTHDGRDLAHPRSGASAAPPDPPRRRQCLVRGPGAAARPAPTSAAERARRSVRESSARTVRRWCRPSVSGRSRHRPSLPWRCRDPQSRRPAAP